MPKKDLQKFAEIRDRESLDAYLNENPEAGYKEMFRYLSSRTNEIYIQGDGPSKDWQKAAELMVYYVKNYGTSEAYEDSRNTLYQFNHIAIIQALHKGIMEFKTMPTIKHIAEDTGLSRTSVHKHLKDIKEQGIENDTRLQQGALVQEAISKLYQIGMHQGNPTALKYFIQFADPSTRAKTVNNYVQINNIKLTQDSIKELPSEVLTTIEEILSPFQGVLEAKYQPN